MRKAELLTVLAFRCLGITERLLLAAQNAWTERLNRHHDAEINAKALQEEHGVCLRGVASFRVAIQKLREKEI